MYPRTTLKVNIHIFGLTKCTIYCKKCSCFCSCFLYAVTMYIYQIKRIISSEKWLNYFFFFENTKNLGRSGDAKRRKKKKILKSGSRSSSACNALNFFFSRILRSEALVYNLYLFFRTAVLRKLFGIRLSYKHCR